MFKLFTLISGLFTTANNSPSFLSGSSIGIIFAYVVKFFSNVFGGVLNWLMARSWDIIQFVLGIMEAFEFMINSFIGIKTVQMPNGTYELRGTTIQDIVDYAEGVSEGQTTSFVRILADTFKAFMGLGIVLLIVFTIIAMIKQEYTHATSGSSDPEGNNKKPIIMGMFKKMLYIFLLPLTMMFIITGVNSILAAFSRAMQGGEQMTVASQMLASSTYDSNKYRYYAQQGRRIPIIIRAYDPNDYDPDEDELLMKKINSSSVQLKLKQTATAIVTNTMTKFEDSVKYENNKLVNSLEYGDYYEHFVCTAEQYQVMADFIDYAQKTRVSFQVKSIDDINIDWKYVDSAVFNKDDVSLKINYRDASDINGNGKTSDSYTMEFSSSFEVTTPISDAMETIMALLGVGDYSDYLYKTMERDEDYVNVVQWQNEKVLIKLEGKNGVPFNINDISSWSRLDQLIIYEYYHFSSNNTFGKYTIADLIEGVELDAAQISYREYYAESNAYSPVRTIDCVKINGTYYKTVQDPYKTDKYGNIYYVLQDAIDSNEEGGNQSFLKQEYATINKQDSISAKLKLSERFKLNDPITWTYTDQILVYEYYKDLTYNNDLYKYDFNDFKNGVETDVYYIMHRRIDGGTSENTGRNGHYVLINGVYYQVQGSGLNYSLVGSESEHFLNVTGGNDMYLDTYYYNYLINLDDSIYANQHGISTNNSSNLTADQFLKIATDSNRINYVIPTDDDSDLKKYAAFSLKLSDVFNYEDVNTWTYKDYFIFYLYINYPKVAGSLGIDSLKYVGVNGQIVKLDDGKYYYQVKYGKSQDGNENDLFLYIDMDKVMKISNLNINKTLNHTFLLQTNLDGDYIDLFVNVNENNFTDTPTELTVFKFSEDFQEAFPATWTVLDYILYTFSKQGIINSVEDIKENGYSALLYKIYDDETSTEETEQYYKFGSKTNADKRYFLSLKGVKNLKNINGESLNFSTVNEFLNTKLLNYVAQLYSTNTEQIITDNDGIVNNLFDELRGYIHDSDYIINTILEAKGFKVDGNTFEVYDNVSLVTYKSSAKFEDLSTWTKFDAIMYCLTKSLKSTYAGNVISYNSKNYFVYGDYAIDISDGSPFESNFVDNNIIESEKSRISATDNVRDYYADYVTDNISGKITQYSTGMFKYTKSDDETTDFEVIYEALTGEAISKGSSKEFYAYSDGSKIYLKIDGKDSNDNSNKTYYVSVGTTFSDNISISIGGILTLEDSSAIASMMGEYTAFDVVVNESTNILDLDSCELDALIFKDLGSTEKTTLKIYTLNGSDYIYTGKSYIKYETAITENKDLSEKFSDATRFESFVNDIYDKYYRKYVSYNVSGITLEDTYITYRYNSKAESAGPLAIIFQKLGIIDKNKVVSNETFEVKGKIGKTVNFTYFNYYGEVNGEVKDVYIDITNLAERYYLVGETTIECLRDVSEFKYQMVLNSIYKEMSNIDGKINSYTNAFVSQMGQIYYDADYVKDNKNNLKTGISIAGTFNSQDLITWNYLNILYYYLSGKSEINVNQLLYTDVNGNTYIKVENATNSYYIKLGTNDLVTPFASTTQPYKLKNNDATYSPLGIICYKLIGPDEGEIQKVTVAADGTAGIDFYFIKSGYSVNIVYELPEDAIRCGITGGNYTYTFNKSNAYEWTLFDAIIVITKNSTTQYDINSKIYIYGNSAYVLVNGRYLNLSKIGVLTSAQVEIIFNNLSDAGTIVNDTELFSTYFASNEEGAEFDGYKAFVKLETVPTPEEEPDISDDSEGEEEPSDPVTNDVNLYFSEGFELEDYSTWQLSDYILYYIFYKYPSYFENTEGKIENFNDLVAQGYVPAKSWKCVDEDAFGNTKFNEIYFVGIKDKTGQMVLAVDSAIFTLCYSRKLVGLENDAAFSGAAKITLNISDQPIGIVPGNANYPNISDVKNLSLPKNIAMNANDFVYDNYYYFNLSDNSVIDALQDVLNEEIIKIKKGTAKTTEAINIALSSDFDINDRSTWTWLDFIIVYEFSNTAIRHNYFEGVEFDDLKIESYLPVFDVDGKLIIEINGDYYNLLKIGDTVSEIRDSKTLKTVISSISTVGDLVQLGTDKEFTFKTLASSIEYKVSKESLTILDYSKTPDSILFSIDDTINYMTVNTNIIGNYGVNFKLLNCGDNYVVSNLVRQVNWPQKLMNDMQVIYPDLNWATLIATDGWLDMLGDFTSAQSSGEFVSEGNSANITAAGLVLSEFFVSVAKDLNDVSLDVQYAYAPVYDEDVIKSLMLSMLGEEEYNDISTQGAVFIEMFNNMFLPVLEDIAKERGESIVNGKIDSFYISIYKAYLATLLLGSDMGEYFYKIATRVYSQYTILDALASASGDYAAYLDYINTLSGEDGGSVNAFNYASFHELCIYENSFTGNSNPTFTFSFEKALKGLYGEDVTYGTLKSNGYSIIVIENVEESDVLNTAGAKKILANEFNFKKMLKALNDKYNYVYLTLNSKISDLNTDGLYCFMLDAYWSIKQDLKNNNKKEPVYLGIYYEYLTGEIKRWKYTYGVSTDASSGYIPDFNDYVKAVKKARNAAAKAALAVYFPDFDQIDVEETGSLWDKVKDLLNDSTITSWTVLEDVFNYSGSPFNDAKRAYLNVVDKDGLFGSNDLTDIRDVINDSMNGNLSEKYRNLIGDYKYEKVDAWQRLNAIYDDIAVMTKCLKELTKLNFGDYYRTPEGITVAYKDPKYKDGRFTKAYTELLDLYDAIGNYISSQHTLDVVYKTSITFTLGQFGKNYVTDGYTFSFENKSYTMKATASPERLAEYVYGGAFLAKYGVPPTYTNSEYNGFIESYRVYDSETKSLRTKLNVWTELRTFASELANYTSRLYYLSNMNDLSNNVGDAILLTNYVYESASNKKTLEHFILDYLVDSDLSADTLLRLTFGDTVQTLTEIGCQDKEIFALAHYLEGTNYLLNNGAIVYTNNCPTIVINGSSYLMTSAQKRKSIKEYLNLVADDGLYDSDGYYNDGADSSEARIHKIFKKTISYLIVTEEEGESVSENAVNLDNINFKQFRQILMKALSDYQKNPSESDLENQNRYISLFNLVSAQFNYTYDGDKSAGTAISQLYLQNVNGVMHYKPLPGVTTSYQLSATFTTDIATRDIVLHLAGVENRPIEDLVSLEYDNLYDRNGNYDEEMGDVFILTTYNEADGKYYPIMGRSKKYQLSADPNDNYNEYMNEQGIDFKTHYYHHDYAYPIIAKGVMDAVGYPTAIKMVDNEIIYYRTSITTSGSVSEDAVKRTRKSAEVTTVGYVKYVDLSYAKPNSIDNMAMFAGSTNMEYAVNAGYDPKYIQIEDAYSVSDPDNFDSIMVLDQFSAFYTLEFKQYFLFLLGFSTLIPILFKASAQVLRRILDLIVLIIMSPVVIASMGINPDQSGKGNKIFDTWKNNLSDTLLHVFGYIIAFNVYYILVSTVVGMNFVSEATMEALGRVGGLTSIFTENSLNSVITYIYVVAAAGAIETSADLLVNIVTGGKSSKAFTTNMSGEVFADIKKAVTEAREIYDAVTAISSGEALTQIKDFAIQTAKNSIPGGKLVAGAIQKGQNIATDIKAKNLEKSAISNGMKPEQAKKMAKKFADNEKSQRDIKRQKSADNANKFLKTTLGTKGNMFSETPSAPKGGGDSKPPKKPKDPNAKKSKKNKKTKKKK